MESAISVYFNEFDPFAAAWLGNLFPAAKVDQRSIKDVSAADLAGHDRVHLFGGIGGWEYALHLAGWRAAWPVWTGSCPCQPYSAAGKQKGQADERHLWPEMFRLIRECRPPVVFGEQVEAAIRFGWLDGVFADLEAEGYACGAAVLGAHSVGAPHIRQRIYWVAESNSVRHDWRKDSTGTRQPEQHHKTETGLVNRGVGNADGAGSQPGRQAASIDGHGSPAVSDGSVGVLGNTERTGLPRESLGLLGASGQGHWSDYDLITCRDGKTRRIESGTFPLAARLSADVVRSGDSGAQIDAKATAEARQMRLKGYGNSIVPQLAAAFIRAYLETTSEDMHEVRSH